MLLLASVLAILAAEGETPVVVSVCDLLSDRAAYNHRLVEVTAFVSHGFENFSLFDPRCLADGPLVWLEYGGSLSSGTIYCCGAGSERRREAPVVLEGIPLRLIEDEALKQFDSLIQRETDVLVRATIRGRFFSGKEQEWNGSRIWIGYGHFGLHSLLAIEQIVSVEPHDLRGIDYRSSSEPPDFGDDVRLALIQGDFALAIQQQHQADHGETWRFRDHRRVAREALASALGTQLPPRLQLVERAAGRMVYRAELPASRITYTVIVSRPYWLTSFASRRGRVAWVPLAIHEGRPRRDAAGHSECGGSCRRFQSSG